MSDDLIAFMNARLDEDEAAAKAWLPFGNPDAAAREHVARHDPGRVLREVAAKRAIIAEHIHMNGGSCLICHYQVGPQLRPAPWPCPTIRALAAIWSDHPGHREEWRPSR